MAANNKVRKSIEQLKNAKNQRAQQPAGSVLKRAKQESARDVQPRAEKPAIVLTDGRRFANGIRELVRSAPIEPRREYERSGLPDDVSAVRSGMDAYRSLFPDD